MKLCLWRLFALITLLSGLLQTPAFAQETQDPLVSGMELYRGGKYRQALAEFQKASSASPDDADILFFIGLTYSRLNESEKAIEYFQKSVDIKPLNMDARFQLGLALTQNKAFREAIPHLEAVYKKEPDREDLGYFLGYAYYQTGQYREALDHLKSAKTNDKAVADLVLYYAGLAGLQLGQNTEAEAAYKQLIINNPTSPLAEPSKRLVELIDGERLKERFALEVTTKVQYDDNVVLVPTTNVFSLRDNKRKSVIELFYLRGDYALLREPNYDLTASYGFYQTITNSIREMDVQDHIASLDFSKRGHLGAMPYDFRLNYAYDYLLSDYKYFLQRHTVRPTFMLLENGMNLSLVQYAFQVKEFRETPEFPEDNRDALNHEAGLIHYLRFNDVRHYMRAGYFYDREFAEGSNWDYYANKFLAGAQITFPCELRLNLDYEYKTYRYDNENIFFLEKRKDIERSLTAALSKAIGKNWNVSLEYLNRRNSSNIALYDYKKNLYSIGLSWRW